MKPEETHVTHRNEWIIDAHHWKHRLLNRVWHKHIVMPQRYNGTLSRQNFAIIIECILRLINYNGIN